MTGYRICRKSVLTGRTEAGPVLPEHLARFRLEQEKDAYVDAKYWLEPAAMPVTAEPVLLGA